MLRSILSNKPELKSAAKSPSMREAGKLVAEALRLCRSMAKPGTKTIEIDQAVEALYASRGSHSAFQRLSRAKCRFPPVTCISINEQVVHGIPGQRIIKDGDLLKIDTACKLNGWCADAAVTIRSARCRRKSAGSSKSAESVLQNGHGGDGAAAMVVGSGAA